MEYYVVAYPKISKHDLAWIQEYRKTNDRQYGLVDPHFTLVFAVTDIQQVDLIEEIKKQAQYIKPFKFEIKIATTNFSGDYTHEFLVPDQGFSDIVKLHDKLYSDLLADRLRLDVNFVPHITVGSSDDPKTSKQRVDQLNSQNISVAGTIDSIDVLKSDGGEQGVTTIERIQL